MECPQLYDSADYNKKSRTSGVKVKSGNILYSGEDVDYGELAELSAPEISLDLHNLIDDSQFNEGLIQDIQGLTVDKNNTGHRGLGVNNMYNPLAYLPQPVHGAAQFDRHYQDRSHLERPHIKEEPHDQGEVAQHEYSACARVGPAASGYGASYAGVPPTYSSMTPTTVPGADGVCRSPLKSPTGGKMIGGCKKILDKGSDEYKRRRERNNIAVRKSREKAKARTRETEERVKKLILDNDRLHKKCEILSQELAAFHSMFANIHNLPDHVQRDLRKQMDSFNQQKHLLNM